MKTVVTGGAGFIGSHTVDLLLQKGHEVRIIDSLESPVHRQKEKPAHVPGDAEFILGDVRDRDTLSRAIRNADVIFHLAAYQDYLTNFSKFAYTNDVSTALLYEIIVDEHLPVRKVVLASSQAVYGEGKYECPTHYIQYPSQRPLEHLLVGEWEIGCPLCQQRMTPLRTDESRVNPHNQYAISKYCQELYALNLGKKYGIPTVALRYSITQGPRQSFFNAYSGILRTFVLRILNGLPPMAYEDGQQLRDYVYVGDVAKANLLAMETNSADYQSLNVGGNQTTTVLEYAQLLLDLCGRNTIEPELRGEFRFGDTRHCISDISKLCDLGWEPTTPIKQIAEEYLAWVETQPNADDYYEAASQVMRDKGILRRSVTARLERIVT